MSLDSGVCMTMSEAGTMYLVPRPCALVLKSECVSFLSVFLSLSTCMRVLTQDAVTEGWTLNKLLSTRYES